MTSLLILLFTVLLVIWQPLAEARLQRGFWCGHRLSARRDSPS